MPERRDDLTCAEVVELVTDYLEGALAAPERARFERHLAGCEGCTSYLDQMRHTIATTGRLGADDLPARLREDLLDAFRGWKAGGG